MQTGQAREGVIQGLLAACAYVSILTTVGIVFILGWETIGFFREVSLSQFFLDTEWTPLFVDKHFGIWPLVCGTFVTSAIALVTAVPTGLIISVYLSEYAGARTRGFLKPTLEVLAGIPTVVYGYFALLWLTPALQRFIPGLAGFNALSPGIVMGVMILPTVISLSDDAFLAVPMSLREAGFALGASRLQVAWRIVFPAAFSGVAASVMLAASRAVGETMIVAIAAGQQPRFTLNPIEPIETMTAYIVQISLGDTPHGTIEYKTVFVVGMGLFVLTLMMNVISLKFRQRLREVYQ